MTQTLFLVDGYSHFYQSFYALPGLTAPDGTPTGAVFGLARLLALIDNKAPDFVAVVLDTKEPTFRHKAFPAYKATRSPMPDDLRAQSPLLHRFLDVWGIRTVAVPGFEADDVIGTLATQADEAGVETFIVSRDKDLKQLLSDRVRLFDFKSGATYDAGALKEDTGLTPAQFRDFLGIAGDTSDNIPGISKLGPKKATELLKRYDTLDGVLAHWEDVAGLKGFGKKTSERIRDSAEEARLSLMLATIRTDVPLEVTYRDLVLPEKPASELKPLYEELGFRSLLADLDVLETTADADYGAVTSMADLAALVESLADSQALAFDLETTSLDPHEARLAGVSLSRETGTGRYVPILTPEGEPSLDEAEVLAALEPLLSDPTILKVGQNLKFDISILLASGVEVVGPLFDTLVAAYLLNPGERALGLDALAARHLAVKTVPIADLIGSGKEEISFDAVTLEKAAPYACEDADVAFRLYELFAPRLGEEGLADLFREVEMPLVTVLAAMEVAGIALDATVLETLGGEVDVELAAMTEKIYGLAGEEFNIQSPTQLRPILFEKLGLPVKRKTKTGPSTAEDVLEELAHLHPLPGLIVEHRQLKKLKTTYIEVLPAMVNPATGRIHADFNQTVTATGRLSSSNPNLQNIPVRTATGRRIREAFTAPAGHVLLAADYSQVELRMLAHLSGDEHLQAAFAADRDIHTEVAAQIFGLPLDGVDDDTRRKAKAVNFGLIYGQTAYGLSRFVSIPVGEAQAFIDTYFSRFPGVRAFFDRIIGKALETRQVRTIRGRLRGVPDITSTNKNRRAQAERLVLNTTIQGSAADLIKVAMVNLSRRLGDDELPARLLVQIHDELLLEVAEEAAGSVERAVVEEMEGAMDLHVPLKVDTVRGVNWRHA